MQGQPNIKIKLLVLVTQKSRRNKSVNPFHVNLRFSKVLNTCTFICASQLNIVNHNICSYV